MREEFGKFGRRSIGIAQQPVRLATHEHGDVAGPKMEKGAIVGNHPARAGHHHVEDSRIVGTELNPPGRAELGTGYQAARHGEAPERLAQWIHTSVVLRTCPSVHAASKSVRWTPRQVFRRPEPGVARASSVVFSTTPKSSG